MHTHSNAPAYLHGIARYACKTVDIKALQKTPDGPNTVSRLRNEIAIMSYLAGESAAFVHGTMRAHVHPLIFFCARVCARV